MCNSLWLLCSLHVCKVHIFCTQSMAFYHATHAQNAYVTCLRFVYAFIARVHSAYMHTFAHRMVIL